MNNITANINQSVLGTSFGRSANSASSQASLLQAVNSQKIPDIQVVTGGEQQSLSGQISESLGQQKDTLQALSQLNSYSASNSLLAGSYGVQSSSSGALLGSAVSSQGSSSSLLQSAYPYQTPSVDELI